MTERPPDKMLNAYGAERLRRRMVDELIGIARGITADGALSDGELEMLVRWLVAHREITGEPIVAALYRRIQAMLADGVFDDDERRDLFEMLQEFTGPRQERGELLLSTEIPYSQPVPLLGFAGWRYCFTGSFNFGTRVACEGAVVERGAAVGTLTKQTDALVVGHYATESWLHSTYGLKIMKAADMQNEGHHIVIVPEEHWASYL